MQYIFKIYTKTIRNSSLCNTVKSARNNCLFEKLDQPNIIQTIQIKLGRKFV